MCFTVVLPVAGLPYCWQTSSEWRYLQVGLRIGRSCTFFLPMTSRSVPRCVLNIGHGNVKRARIYVVLMWVHGSQTKAGEIVDESWGEAVPSVALILVGGGHRQETLVVYM